jgi:hypothetical protein
VQPLENFYKEKTGKDGYRNDCKACLAARAHERYQRTKPAVIARVKRWQEQNPERYAAYLAEYRARPERKKADRAGHLKRKFGLTPEQYDEMLAAQDGRCMICRRPPAEGKTLDIDHDHETGRVRGLLCRNCNHGVGKFFEDVWLLMAAAGYLIDADCPGHPPSRVRLVIGG